MDLKFAALEAADVSLQRAGRWHHFGFQISRQDSSERDAPEPVASGNCNYYEIDSAFDSLRMRTLSLFLRQHDRPSLLRVPFV